MNKTIHELNALVTLANDDELIVYDVATGTSKKIKKSDLKNQLASDFIIDAVQDGNLKAVTSNAVFDYVNNHQDSYEQTRYNPTINTTYVKDMSVADGVSVYKTKNGLKVLTGFFEAKADLTAGISDLFTFPEACRQTRPAQLFITMVSISTGKSYPLLFSGTQLATWGAFFPTANDVLFIPPVTYL